MVKYVKVYGMDEAELAELLAKPDQVFLAVSILSDAQEIVGHDGEYGAEVIRQRLNVVKRILIDHRDRLLTGQPYRGPEIHRG